MALVVLTAVTGGTLRARGALMAVTDTHVAGYVSNGCVDADIVTRARSGQTGRFIYGDGSPYKDIVLPCGGRLEIEIIQNPNQDAIQSALNALENRQEAQLRVGDVSVSLVPRLKLRISGRGEACLAMAELAALSGFEVSVQSPDPHLFAGVQHLTDPNHPPKVNDDKRTAVICLFHDHDWEGALLQQALTGPAFYIGAMGSKRTHDMRCQKLLDMGTAEQAIARVKGPIGLIPAQRDARLLALSVLAEIMDEAQKAGVL